MSVKDSFIYLFTGDGKGKTTAALGQAVRAKGHGWRVLIVQFIKQKPSGEVKSLKRLGIKVFAKGAGFVGIMGDKKPPEEHRQAAKAALDFAREKAESGRFDLLILDEVNTAVSLGLLEEGEVLSFLEIRPKDLNVILTGRGAPESFIKAADLVTEMKEIKHPIHAGHAARPGLDC